jgi:L-arabinokinase
MFRITNETTHHLPDLAAFIETLNSLDQNPVSEIRHMFDQQSELYLTRAPGRLDVMGGIADYSGSLVLELPILEATFVAIQRDPMRRLKIASISDESAQTLLFEMPLSDFERGGEPIDYETARSFFRQDSARHWASYVAGVFLVLMRELGADFHDGARLLINSRVPQGKGVSSSAALEVAVMQSVAAAYGLTIDPREMAILCQRVENMVAGAPCGVMDQMTATCGETNRLLALYCQPAELRGLVTIPDEIMFWGLDSGVRHAVTGSDYASVRIGAFMGYRIIAELAGLEVHGTAASDRVQINDPIWGGYLANITPSEFEQVFAAHLPDRIEGADFLRRYQGTTDHATRVSPGRSYAVRVPTAHAIYEHHRVRLFAELLKNPVNERGLELLGELMYQSHASYSACGLGSPSTDRLVKLVREAEPDQSLYGAKITGGGSGGTVAVLSSRGAADAITRVAQGYSRETGVSIQVFSGSSPGSAAFGHLILERC